MRSVPFVLIAQKKGVRNRKPDPVLSCLGAIAMFKKLLIVGVALFATACVPIPAQPLAESEPTQMTEQPADCPGGYLDMLPGQSADDPISEELPGYIDIIGVDSSLDGETLTAIFYLREIPEEMSFNRKGVEDMHLEYMWTVEIDVEMGDEDESELLEYTLTAFYPARRVLEDTPAAIRLFQNAIRTAVWKNVHYPEKNETRWEDVLVHDHMLVSHEDNTLTLISQIPGITDESTLLFSTYDILLGQDGVSCLPSAEASKSDSKVFLTTPSHDLGDDTPNTIGLEEGCDLPPIMDAALLQCETDTAAIIPGQTVTDEATEELPAHIDITEVKTALSGETLTVVFHLRDVPETLAFGRACVQESILEYMWQASVDVDNDPETGWYGFDYTLSASYFVLGSRSGMNRDAPIEHEVQANSWEVYGNGGGTYLESVSIEVSPQEDTITLVGDIPGITPESVLAFETYDYLHGSEKVACLHPQSPSDSK